MVRPAYLLPKKEEVGDTLNILIGTELFFNKSDADEVTYTSRAWAAQALSATAELTPKVDNKPQYFRWNFMDRS